MAKWSDYGLQKQKSHDDPGTLGGLGMFFGAGMTNDLLNDTYSVTDAMQDAADSRIEELNKMGNSFAGATSYDDLINAAKSYKGIDYLTDSFTADDFSKNAFGTIFGGAAKGAEVGTGIMPGWGTLIGTGVGLLSSGFMAGENQKRAEEAARIANNITKNLNEEIFKANERQQQNYNLMAKNISNNMNRQAWANMAALGGPLHSYGADWRTGLTEINNGGSHEQNPYEGVPFGVAPDGQPNLVEEGEVIWNDYAFSNRLKAPEDLKKEYKFGGNITTFADIARTMKERYDERPNDPIAKRTLNDFMTKLAQSQETIRQELAEKQLAKNINMYANGGGLNRKEDYGSKKKPYPSVKKKDFAGGGRSYPIPTKADAVDALRLAGLHNRPDVKAKVYKKYPELKHALGGHLFDLGGPDGDIFNGLYWHYDPELANNYVTQSYTPSTIVNIPMLREKRTEPELLTTSEYLPNMGTEITAAPTAASTYKWDLDEAINNPIQTNNSTPKTKSTKNGYNAAGMAMRLASALGPALGALSAAWSKPKYEWANELKDAANRYANSMTEISYNPIGQYLAYRPFDRNYYLNRLDSQIAANRRAARDLSGGNRASALAAMNASDMAALDKYGQLARAGEEYNQAQREKVAAFNRDTDKFNSQMDLEAQRANASIKEARAKMQLQALMQALGWNRQDDMMHSGTLAANLSQLFNNIGSIGTEMMNRADRKALADSGMFQILNDYMKGLFMKGE